MYFCCGYIIYYIMIIDDERVDSSCIRNVVICVTDVQLNTITINLSSAPTTRGSDVSPAMKSRPLNRSTQFQSSGVWTWSNLTGTEFETEHFQR